MDKFSDECGIAAISLPGDMDAANQLFYGLNGIQHRGQESAGIAVRSGTGISCYKEMGLVTEVFDDKILSLLKGDMCLGHVKYANASENFSINAQPMVINYKRGALAVAFNGGLLNGAELREEMEENGAIFSTKSDCEVIASLIARFDKGDIGLAILKAAEKIRGGYALGLMTEKAIIGVRDPYGIRPLALGKSESGWMLASESCAFDMMGGDLVRDLLPGEILIIEGEKLTTLQITRCQKAHCIFEYIYFARPDSTLDGKNVYQSRVEAGRILAAEAPANADVIIGVPDSGTPAAIGFAKGSGIVYSAGLIKNNYIGRTFIKPTQEQRETGVKIKLNPIKQIVEGKSVVLVDDSIVRGTTMRMLIAAIRNAGATEVHLRISSPPVYNSCFFGVDTPDVRDLIANSHTIEEIRRSLDADSLAFISVTGLLKSVSNEGNSYCTGCFDGNYPIR